MRMGHKASGFAVLLVVALSVMWACGSQAELGADLPIAGMYWAAVTRTSGGDLQRRVLRIDRRSLRLGRDLMPLDGSFQGPQYDRIMAYEVVEVIGTSVVLRIDEQPLLHELDTATGLVMLDGTLFTRVDVFE